ncbi:diguanylate cyclase [Pseudodesulfovibrio sp.]|uniref:diguanylate cyclase n=1 Tax=unclassified Pseudodesulfovibrio TaxID=2661612 RepID=UPI003AFFD23D
MRILIIDDCKTTILHISRLLESAGYREVYSSSTFEEGFRILCDLQKAGLPIDLILMDVSLPGTDGIAGTLTIKGHRDFENLPVIMVTGRDDEATFDRAFAAGVSDFILKPVNRVELRARIRSALQLRREMLKSRERERELERLAHKLERMSNQDGLTNLANRRCFDDTLLKEWVRNGREDKPIGLLMIDIDHFKHYNDTLGHVDGDACLCTVAQVIQGAVHRPGDLVARYGGEEFVVILPNTDYQGAYAVAANIHASLAKTGINHPNSSVCGTVTVSIGVAAGIPTCQSAPEQLVQTADKALYRAKQAGRNRTEVIPLAGPDEIRQ